MGCFDTLYMKCPKCGGNVDFQSKADGCQMNRYNKYQVSNRLLIDVQGETSECETCKTSFVLTAQITRDIQLVEEEPPSEERVISKLCKACKSPMDSFCLKCNPCREDKTC